MKRIMVASAFFLGLGTLSPMPALAQGRPSQDTSPNAIESRRPVSDSARMQRGEGRDIARRLELDAAKRPADPAPMLAAASTYEALGDLGAAHAAAQKALDRDADSIGALLVLGRIAIRQQNWEIAAAYLKRATLLDPRNRAAQLDLGQALEKTGDQVGADTAYAAFRSLAAD